VQRTAGSSVVEGRLVDRVRTRPTPEPRLPVAWLPAEEKAEELQRLQRNRARNAARSPTSSPGEPLGTVGPTGCA
jgi:hypothetical protein